MKKLFVFMGLTMIGSLGLAACDNGTNSNTVNVNRSTVNSNSTMMNDKNSNINNSMNSNMNNSNMNKVAVVQDNFWTEAAQGGMAEVELGKLALTKAQNPEVKKFAQTMITDHTKANTELKTLAAKKNITLPTDVGSGNKSIMDDLNKLSGAEFDKAYVEAMVDDHEDDVEFFEGKTSDTDADIKAFATKTLPTLKSHLEMIKAIQSKMK